ncbi:MAG: hypothetical protein Q9204_000218 [Flavoplaca sp. TL-2023a]
MRGLSKAAALLSSFYASASTLPPSNLPESASLPDYVIEYNDIEASVVFRVSEPITPGVVVPPVELQIGSTSEPCGESNLRVGGQKLPSNSDGSRAIEIHSLNAYHILPNISCLEDVVLHSNGGSDGRDAIQIAQFGIYDQNKHRSKQAGFTVSFRSSGKPEILRLVPVWTAYSDIEANPEVWRTSSINTKQQSLDPEYRDSAHIVHHVKYVEGTLPKSLKAHIGHVQELIGTAYYKARQTFQSWCPTQKKLQSTLGQSHTDGPSTLQNSLATTPTIKGSQPDSLPTRSAAPEPASITSIYELPIGTWDEKRARVLEKEEVLEEVMEADIRKLRNHQNTENNISAAEQGRSIYMYDSDDARQRSRETLPGYESDGTQPPSYDTGTDGEMSRVANGFRYIPADREDTPDSSVISTSPRTSRDDRDSDFGKDFEPLTLGATAVNVC